jgi:hypothetical protein
MALATTITASPEVSAHRTEDYLQTARIGVEPDRVQLTLDLTPGIAVAESFLATLDHDRDGSLSPEEQRGYAEEVTSALALEIDGRRLQSTVLSSRFPDPPAFRSGEGTIRLSLQAALPEMPDGPHHLLFRNAHLAGHSAYLANALVPESARVAVTAQRRDRDQSELTIDYMLHGGPASTLARVLSRLATAFSLP